MIFRFYMSLLFVPLILAACATATPINDVPANQSSPSSIGTVNRVTDTIQHNENQLIDPKELLQNDSLRLFDGGEGLLDFGSDLRMRLFNDTELGGVRTANDPGTPLVVKMTLFSGGFTGQMFSEGGEAEFTTPNGALIRVFGTTFVVVYDRETQETFCANFEGDMRVEAAGSELIPIPAGTIYVVRPGEEPELWGEIPWTPAEFEDQARADQSPLAPFVDVPVTGDEPTVTPTDTFTPTLEPTTATPTDTYTPTPSNTPTPTDTPTPTPTKTPIPCPPKLNVIKNAFCREGPSQVYEVITGFEIGEVLQVEGRIKNETWWWVLIPNSSGHCWISDVTVEVIGEASCVAIKTPPPTPLPPDSEPPVIDIIHYDPTSLSIGVECPGAPDTVDVIASVSDESEIGSMIAYWEIGGQGHQTSMEKVDDFTYSATVGPVSSTGELFIEVRGEDVRGNTGKSAPVYITVSKCIG